jgi:hypothetical protein
MVERPGFHSGGADLAADRKRLIVKVHRLLLLARRIVDQAEVAERKRFSPTFTDCAIKRESLGLTLST